MKEALFYTKIGDNVVTCELCPHRCRITQGSRGICKARENIDGGLYSRTYSEICSIAMDPIEKKPLYHFYPGSEILSVGSYGCNFFCLFCQNWQVSQNEVETMHYTPEEIVQAAMNQGSLGIAFTYNEPLINYEFVRDTSILARECGLKNVLVTNGYINPEPLTCLLEYIDGVNLDIKAGENEFYSSLCGGSINPVLATAKAIHEAGVHLEVTTLLIPGENDDKKELDWLAGWIAENCGKNTVAHLSAYFPRYKFDSDGTSADDLIKARGIFKGHLEYVYCGNMALGAECSNTYCFKCGNELIRRIGYQIDLTGVDIRIRACCKCYADVPFCL